ncbi:MAG: MFS transporter [Candidatus Aramenus sp.]|jgi:hypothetical protein|nr:MFS transporter [Candidatus Aramenus sp.]
MNGKHRRIALLYYIYISDYLSSFISMVRNLIFPIYAYELGYSPLIIASFLGIFYLLVALLSYPSLFVVKKIGARNSVLLCNLTDAISLLLLSFNSLTFFYLSFGIISIAQIFASQFTTLIAHNFEESELKGIYSKRYGIAVVGYLSSIGLSAITNYFGIVKYIFLPLGIIYLLTVFFVLLFRPTASEVKNFKLIPSKESILAVIVVRFIGSLITALTISLLQVFYLKIGLNGFDVSIVYLLEYVANLISYRVVDKIKEESLIKYYIPLSVISSILVSLISLRIYAVSVSMLIASDFVGTMVGLVESVLSIKLLKRLNQVEVGNVLKEMFGTFGGMIGVVMEGYLLSLGLYALPFVIRAIMSLVIRVWLYDYYKKMKVI